MHRTLFKLLLTIFFTAGLSACDMAAFTMEGKINAAIPPSSEITLAKNDLLASASDQRKALEEEFSRRLKLRALSCSKGYAPSWLASSEQILKQFPNRTCFNEADAGIAKWIGLRRAGILLAMPPLRPIPASPAKFFFADSYVQTAVFADQAGVALFATQKSVQVIDMEAGKPLFQEARSGGQFGGLSPNGRLFTSSSDGKLKVHSAETGAVLLELAKVRPQEIRWFGKQLGIYTANDSNKATLIDFASGNEMPVLELENLQSRVMPMAESENQYLVGSYRALSKIEVVKKDQDVSVKLIDEKPVAGGWSASGAAMNSDGQYVFSVSRELMLAATKNLEVEKIQFEPFGLQSAVPTADPDKLFLTGYMRSSTGNGARSYLYSISSRALTAVDRTKLPSERIIYIPSLKRLAAVYESKVALLDELPLGEEIAFDKFMALVVEEANQRKLEDFNRMQLSQENSARYASSYPSALAPAQAPAAPSSSTYGTNNSAPLASLVKNAQIEAIGVYQSSNASKRSGEAKIGQIEIRIRRSSKPVVLVLSSYESVKWNLVYEPGARVAAILLSGYNQSQVAGAGAVRIVNIGRSYAYQMGTRQYAGLERDVAMLTGMRIGLFQGRYDGSSFSVGGI